MAYYIDDDGHRVRVAGIGLNPDEREVVGCGCTISRDNENKKVATLTFSREQLLYDLRTIAYVEGDTNNAQNDHNMHQLVDIGEDGNIDRVTRLLDLAHAEAKELLYPHTKVDIEDGATYDDILTETDVYTINLLVPERFSDTTARYWEHKIHEYMICRVLAEWMMLTNKANPNAAALWEAKAQQAIEDIKESFTRRTQRVRRSMHPF